MPPLSVTLKSNEMATAIIRRAGVCGGTQLQVIINSASSSLIASYVLFFLFFSISLWIGDREYDASDEKAMGTVAHFP